MRKKRLLWQLFPLFLILIVVSVVAVTWYATSSFRHFSVQQTAEVLKTRGHLAAPHLIPAQKNQDYIEVQKTCRELGELTGTRFTLIDLSGAVIADSEEDPVVMDNHGDRPEIMGALDSGFGQAIRYSYTLKQNMIYVALPIVDAGVVLGTLRLSLPITAIEETLDAVYRRVAWAGLAVALLTAIVSFFVSRRVSRPLEQMRRAAKRFAGGDLTHKIPESHILELGSLAASMNQMAEQLDDKMQTVVRQRNEQEAVLAGMTEGVLAIDSEARLITANRAAAEMFSLSPDRVHGRTLPEIIRHAALLEFVDNVLTSGESGEAEIILFEKGERYFQVHGTLLKDAGGEVIGALFVLNDITGLRRLETVRRDFVANVSHELKTPVTAVKGFVETLLDSAMDDPETARRFLEIISRQADRLQAIIDDLLSLSRLEQEADKAQISMAPTNLQPIIGAAIKACELTAAEKNVKIVLSCDEKLTARINAPLMEQAIINLIDNAVKYSDEGGEIKVLASATGKEIVIEVSDNGIGIAEEHLPRLFERFYRVDKARSRKMGGTGLGLAIVKHIIQIHGGYPGVVSEPGKGSTFSITLPGGED